MADTSNLAPGNQTETHELPPKSMGQQFASHLRNMPGWHKFVLSVGMLLAGGGIVGQVISPSKSPAPTQQSAPAPTGAKLVTDSSEKTDTATSATPQDEGSSRFAPPMTKVGVSLILGFLIGWIFRTFIKTAALVAAAIVGGIMLLNHFGIVKIFGWDVAGLKEQSQTVLQWMTTQASDLLSKITAHLPSASSGAFGAFLGFRRR